MVPECLPTRNGEKCLYPKLQADFPAEHLGGSVLTFVPPSRTHFYAVSHDDSLAISWFNVLFFHEAMSTWSARTWRRSAVLPGPAAMKALFN